MIKSSCIIDPESSLYNTCRDESSYTNSDIKIYDDINEFDKNLPSTVTLLRNQFGSKIYIVGTAHFSKESQDDVSRVIRNVKPDVVMVELCAARIHMLNHDEKTLLEEARDMNFSKIRNITKSNGLLNGLFYVLMLKVGTGYTKNIMPLNSYKKPYKDNDTYVKISLMICFVSLGFLKMSANITRDLGMAPGGEFRRAVQEMKMLANPAICHLGDRAIHITLQRALNGLSTWQTLKIAFKLVFCNNTITKEEVEKCKQKDILEELLEQMADEYPGWNFTTNIRRTRNCPVLL